MRKLYKKMAVLLMALGMALAVAGCVSQDGNESGSMEDSTVTDSDTADTDDPDTGDAETGDSDTEDSSEEEDRTSGSMEVQDNLEIEIGEGEEGAW